MIGAASGATSAVGAEASRLRTTTSATATTKAASTPSPSRTNPRAPDDFRAGMVEGRSARSGRIARSGRSTIPVLTTGRTGGGSETDGRCTSTRSRSDTILRAARVDGSVARRGLAEAGRGVTGAGARSTAGSSWPARARSVRIDTVWSGAGPRRRATWTRAVLTAPAAESVRPESDAVASGRVDSLAAATGTGCSGAGGASGAVGVAAGGVGAGGDTLGVDGAPEGAGGAPTVVCGVGVGFWAVVGGGLAGRSGRDGRKESGSR